MHTKDYITATPSHRQKNSNPTINPRHRNDLLAPTLVENHFTHSPAASVQLQTVDVLDLEIAALSADQLSSTIGHYIETGQKKQVFYINVHGVNLCFRYPWLSNFFNNADVLFCDGAGVKLAAALLGSYIPQRITLADWMWQFAAYAEPREYRMFFLGGLPGVSEKAIKALKERHPNLQIAGSHHGYFNKELGSTENQQVVDMINQAKPDILWVAFGMPIQEQWLLENWHQLDIKVGMNAGAMLDYVSGTTRRAPRWLTDNGMEWLGRLVIEPRRLWRRYLIGNPVFLWRVLAYRHHLLRRIVAQ